MRFSLPQFNGSLRWRLQLWHGLLLALVLVGFGWTAWSLQRASVFTQIDQELEQGSHRIIPMIHPHPGNGFPPPREGPGSAPPPPDEESAFLSEPPSPEGAPPPPPGGDRPPDRRRLQNEEISADTLDHSLYAIAWGLRGELILHSGLTPPNIPRPSPGIFQATARSREILREYVEFLPSGECILVGKNIAPELASLHQFAWMLIGAGSVVLALGLLIGWGITAGALRTLVSISSTAKKIAEGDLSRRIPMPRGENEVSALISVLNQTFAQLESSFARQTQFTADASHELRTPISVVLTHTQNALARQRSPEEYRESLAACHRAARRMNQLTEALLTLVRLDHGDQRNGRKLCRLDQIAAETIELLKPLAAQQNITIYSTLEPVTCSGNPEQLAQVVSNLLSNAIGYNSAGGTVTIKTGSDSGKAILSLGDTGQGIASEDLPHIFKRFYRADKARSGRAGGAGLGLAIAEAIVTAHGGSLEVVSERGSGSSFTACFPS